MNLRQRRCLFAHGHIVPTLGKVRRALADVVRGAVVTVVGIHLHGRERVRAQDAVQRRHAVALVEVFALRRRTAVESTKQARGAGAHIRAAEVVEHVGPCKALVVTTLHRTDGLELVREHHARQSQQGLQLIVAVLHVARSRFLLSERLELRLVRQFDVHRHLVARHVLLHPSAVVITHYLHLRHVVRRDVPRGQIVLAAQHVQPLDVKLRDGLAHITDGSARRHVHARQPFQPVLQRHVALAQERREVVAQRVAPLPQRVGLHRHLLQRNFFRSQHHVHLRQSLFQRQSFRLLLIVDMGELQRHLSRRRILDFKAIHPLRVAAGERQRLAAAYQFHNHITHGLVLQVYHPSRHTYLCRCRRCQHHI